MMKKIIDYVLSFTVVLLLGLTVYVVFVAATKPDSVETVEIHGSSVESLLNDNFVFINMGPAGLPVDQGYMVDCVINDTIYLIPNTEEAGY